MRKPSRSRRYQSYDKRWEAPRQAPTARRCNCSLVCPCYSYSMNTTCHLLVHNHPLSYTLTTALYIHTHTYFSISLFVATVELFSRSKTRRSGKFWFFRQINESLLRQHLLAKRHCDLVIMPNSGRGTKLKMTQKQSIRSLKLKSISQCAKLVIQIVSQKTL